MSNPQSTEQHAVAPRPASAGEGAPPAAETDERPAESTPDIHVIAEGETLADVAAATGATIADLQRLNAIKHPEHIWVGMPVRVR